MSDDSDDSWNSSALEPYHGEWNLDPDPSGGYWKVTPRNEIIYYADENTFFPSSYRIDEFVRDCQTGTLVRVNFDPEMRIPEGL